MFPLRFKYYVAVNKETFLGKAIVAGVDELNDAKNVLQSYKSGIVLDEDNRIVLRRDEL